MSAYLVKISTIDMMYPEDLQQILLPHDLFLIHATCCSITCKLVCLFNWLLSMKMEEEDVGRILTFWFEGPRTTH